MTTLPPPEVIEEMAQSLCKDSFGELQWSGYSDACKENWYRFVKSALSTPGFQGWLRIKLDQATHAGTKEPRF